MSALPFQCVHAAGFSGTGMGGCFLGIDQLDKYESNDNDIKFMVSAACQGVLFLLSTILVFMTVRLLYQAIHRPYRYSAVSEDRCCAASHMSPCVSRSATSGMALEARTWRSRTRQRRRTWHS